jgi:hypothetical protein
MLRPFVNERLVTHAVGFQSFESTLSRIMRINTKSQYLRQLAEDVLPGILDRALRSWVTLY